MSEAKFIFEVDNASTLPVKIYIQGQTPYFIANDSIAKNVSTNTYYRYNAEETRWVKDVSITSLPSTPVGNVKITDNGVYNILNNELTGYSNVDVDVSGGGGGETTFSTDVQFIDYDGTIIKTYSAEDFSTLTQLPENPTHEGLIAQGWNWSLEDAKEYVASNGKLIIGQMYVTDDGKTRLYVNFTDSYKSPELILSFLEKSDVVVDWGDGTTPTTMSTDGMGVRTVSHSYTSGGDYIITIDVLNGNIKLWSDSASQTNPYGLLRASSGTYHTNYCESIFKVEVGSNVSSIDGAFVNCKALGYITIPNSVTSIRDRSFRYCQSLSTLIIPDNVTELGNYVCSECYSLSTLSLSNSVTSLGENLTYFCYCLKFLLIPNSVTSVGLYMCGSCYSLSLVRFSENLTTIAGNSFNNCYALKDVVIPEGVTSLGGTGGTVFINCYSLESINIPNSVTSIGAGTFSGCYSLREINIDNTSDAITGSPWAANGHCQINWLRS